MHPQVMNKLIKPSKVASILDWKKAFNHTVLAVNFHKNRVGIAIASHPSLGIPCLELEPLRFDTNNNTNNNNDVNDVNDVNDNQHHQHHHRLGNSNSNRNKNIAGAIDRQCLERFSDIIEEYKVRTVVYIMHY